MRVLHELPSYKMNDTLEELIERRPQLSRTLLLILPLATLASLVATAPEIRSDPKTGWFELPRDKGDLQIRILLGSLAASFIFNIVKYFREYFFVKVSLAKLLLRNLSLLVLWKVSILMIESIHQSSIQTIPIHLALIFQSLQGMLFYILVRIWFMINWWKSGKTGQIRALPSEWSTLDSQHMEQVMTANAYLRPLVVVRTQLCVGETHWFAQRLI